jgi:hypothetical protein
MQRLLKRLLSLFIVFLLLLGTSFKAVKFEGAMSSSVVDIYREDRKVLNSVKDLCERTLEVEALIQKGSIDASVIEDLWSECFVLQTAVRCSLNLEDLKTLFEGLLSKVKALETYNEEVSAKEKMVSVLGYLPSADEIYMLKCVVEAEVGSMSYEHKMLSTQVVVNRVLSERFSEKTLKGILTAPGQFSTIGNYYNNYRAVTDSTSDAVDAVLSGMYEDKSEGALFYYSPKYCKNQKAIDWFENDLKFLYEIDGVRYFK